MSENLIVKKTFEFALLSVKLYKELLDKKEFVLSKQFLRSATSIGANVNESISAVSKKDFVNKLSISLKEARECKYWLNLIRHSNSEDPEELLLYKLLNDIDSIIKILSSIILTTRKNYNC